MSSFSLTCTLAFLFCLCNIVSADFYYYGPSIGYSVVGLVRLTFKKNIKIYFLIYIY